MAGSSTYVQEIPKVRNEVTDTGFLFGAANVQRLCTLPGGGVAINLITKKESYVLVVSRGGKVTIRNRHGTDAAFTAPASPKRHK